MRQHSEVKAYQAVFALMFAAQRPEYIFVTIAQRPSMKFQEVYAYEFMDVAEPKGAALKRLNQLRQNMLYKLRTRL